MPQTYVITSVKQAGNLQEQSGNLGQSFEGLNLYVQPDGRRDQDIKASQSWMIWKPASTARDSKGSRQSGWALQAVGGSGALLDFSGKSIRAQHASADPNVSLDQYWHKTAIRQYADHFAVVAA